jgi:uracil DNA glycosylase
MIEKIDSESASQTIYPPVEDRYSFMNLAFDSIKIVIIGQGIMD